MTICRTILKQLGGTHRLAAMTGAHRFVDHGNGVSFTIRGSRKANYVKVTLNSLDLYDVQTAIVGKKLRAVKDFENVYCDQLQPIIEEATGLYLSL